MLTSLSSTPQEATKILNIIARKLSNLQLALLSNLPLYLIT